MVDHATHCRVRADLAIHWMEMTEDQLLYQQDACPVCSFDEIVAIPVHEAAAYPDLRSHAHRMRDCAIMDGIAEWSCLDFGYGQAIAQRGIVGISFSDRLFRGTGSPRAYHL